MLPEETDPEFLQHEHDEWVHDLIDIEPDDMSPGDDNPFCSAPNSATIWEETVGCNYALQSYQRIDSHRRKVSLDFHLRIHLWSLKGIQSWNI